MNAIWRNVIWVMVYIPNAIKKIETRFTTRGRLTRKAITGVMVGVFCSFSVQFSGPYFALILATFKVDMSGGVGVGSLDEVVFFCHCEERLLRRGNLIDKSPLPLGEG